MSKSIYVVTFFDIEYLVAAFESEKSAERCARKWMIDYLDDNYNGCDELIARLRNEDEYLYDLVEEFQEATGFEKTIDIDQVEIQP